MSLRHSQSRAFYRCCVVIGTLEGKIAGRGRDNQEVTSMKTILASSALVASLLFAAAPAAVAQQNGKFCLQGGNSGADNCSYDTMEQCRAAMKGTSTKSCTANTATSGAARPSGTTTTTAPKK